MPPGMIPACSVFIFFLLRVAFCQKHVSVGLCHARLVLRQIYGAFKSLHAHSVVFVTPRDCCIQTGLVAFEQM